jgi:hypothetical protein
MTHVILDSNFISRIRRVDSDCGLIELFGDAYEGQCVIHCNQYRKNPCYGLANPACDDLAKKISMEDYLLFTMNHERDFVKISRDAVDIEILFFATEQEPGSIVLSGDSNLLEICAHFSVKHYCFKAAMHHLENQVGGVFDDSFYKTAEMYNQNGDDPFFHYPVMKEKRCAPCDPSRDCPLR